MLLREVCTQPEVIFLSLKQKRQNKSPRREVFLMLLSQILKISFYLGVSYNKLIRVRGSFETIRQY